MRQGILMVLMILTVGGAGAAAQELAPFVLPWDDASGGAADLSGLSDRPAGRLGFVHAAPDGHLYTGQQRIRFLGVNTCFGANFPAKADAEKIAARMAKFGINAVRFHHLDMFPAPNGIRAKAADTRNLDPENLDRLDYFIAQLKSRGIYADLNLLVSRPFSKADGLPEDIEKLVAWKDRHAVGFFDAPILELQKEYARKLLTHVNPYTKTAYADEPAVAIVEINNEAGLVQAYLGGVLDRLPPIYADELQKQWNAWLAKRYGSTDKLREAWQAKDEPAGAELLPKPAAGAAWNLEHQGGAQATIQVGADGVATIQVTALGTEGWHVQWTCPKLDLKAGPVYTLRFRAKADRKCSVDVSAGQAHDPWGNLGFSASPELTDQWRMFEYTFALSSGDANARLVLGNLGKQLATYSFADISLRPGGKLGLNEGEAVEKGSVGLLPRSAQGRTLDAQRDWMAFLLDTEGAYWQAMYHYLKDDLHIKCVVVGTIVGCSTPNLMAQLDAVDTHAYWQHPSFPKGDWDPGNWTIKNLSMVNEAGGILPGLALKRVEGKPHLVTEYNHSAPNTYSSEAPLLVAAYGALQDWDGIFFFAYSHRTNDWNSRQISSYFDLDQHPTKMPNMAIAAAMFRRGDVAPAKEVTVVPMSVGNEIDLLARMRQGWRLADAGMMGIDARVALTQRVAIRTDPASAPASRPADLPRIGDPELLAADTGQLAWDRTHQAKGVVTVNAPRTKAVIGFVDGRSFELGPVNIAPAATRQDWCTIALTLIEGDSFDQSRRVLLVATGDAENTGMGWKNPQKTTVGRDWGKAPSLVEVVPATISLRTGGRVSVWALDAKGQRGQPLEMRQQNGTATFQIGPPQQTLWYEIEVAR